MGRLGVLGISAVVLLLLAGWTTETARLTPPRCSLADTRDRATLTTHRPGQGWYTRFCGPASAVFRVSGGIYRIRGGHCSPVQRPGTIRTPLSSVEIGLLSLGRAPPPLGRGTDFHWMSHPSTQPGVVRIDEFVVQVAGRRFGGSLSGTAIVGQRLNGGTFRFYGRYASGRTGVVAGSWTCGEQVRIPPPIRG